MIYIARWKAWLILAVCAFGIVFSLPNLLAPQTLQNLPVWLQNTINLGLELRGGSHLQLEVDLKAVQKDQVTNLLDEVRLYLRKHKVGYTSLTPTIEKKGVLVTLRKTGTTPTEAEPSVLQKNIPDITVTKQPDGSYLVALTEQALENRTKAIVEKSIEVIRRRIDESGTKEPLIQRQGMDRIIVQLPGVDDPAEMRRLLGKTAKLTFHMVDETVGAHGYVEVGHNGRPTVPVPSSDEVVPKNARESHETEARYVVIKRQVSISGDHLIDARLSFDKNGLPGVSIQLDSVGSRKLADISVQNVGRRFAIVLDSKVLTDPSFREPLPGGNALISGGFTPKEANELALLLRAGSLPAPLHVLEEKTVGPSLGADSIHAGKMATVFAFIFVAIFMVMNYSLFGVFADIALAFNLIILVAALSLLQATLTLPGIAGIALTIGMAVDANVLIYERIKEELNNGMRPVNAVESGYKRALTTIIDSNLTTLIGAAVLFEFGSGPIRGFAVTLALGIVISLFSAISLTRLMVVTWLRRKKHITHLPI